MRGTRSNGRSGGSSTATYGGSHAQAAGRGWTAEVSLSSGGTAGGWSTEDRRTSFGESEPYATAVRARIQILAARGDDLVASAEETIVAPGYMVEVDYGQDAHEGDVVEVTTCEEDPTLEGRTLRVDQVVRGTDRFTRGLFCTLQAARAEETR